MTHLRLRLLLVLGRRLAIRSRLLKRTNQTADDENLLIY
jgi:hypothetical protein